MGYCYTCGGDGTVPCPGCSGTGQISYEYGVWTPCNTCNGSGKIECPNCQGSGKDEDD